MARAAGAGQGETLGHGVEHPTPLLPSEGGLERGRDGRCRGAHAALRCRGYGLDEAEVGGIAGEAPSLCPFGDDSLGASLSVARSSMRPMNDALSASASSARAQPAFTRAAVLRSRLAIGEPKTLRGPFWHSPRRIVRTPGR